MDDKRSFYRNRFDFFVYGFMAMVGVSISVYAIILSGGAAMIQPLPNIVLAGFIISGIFAVMALVNYFLMLRTPKDTRLDDLISEVKLLNERLKSIQQDNNTNAVADIVNGIALITKAIMNMTKEKKDNDK